MRRKTTSRVITAQLTQSVQRPWRILRIPGRTVEESLEWEMPSDRVHESVGAEGTQGTVDPGIVQGDGEGVCRGCP